MILIVRPVVRPLSHGAKGKRLVEMVGMMNYQDDLI
jgi:hypothetical protein